MRKVILGTFILVGMLLALVIYYISNGNPFDYKYLNKHATSFVVETYEVSPEDIEVIGYTFMFGKGWYSVVLENKSTNERYYLEIWLKSNKEDHSIIDSTKEIIFR